MSEPSLETNERISRRFFNTFMTLVKELEAEGDQEGLETLPTVMLTTGVMAMCRSLGIETVGGVLEALRLKVVRGDFTSDRDVEEV
ncbi:MAG: hypothetical protein LBP55_00925 [Candidatus Adiutrix sp.]|jgi:hypothetical protein|nr:hypothetical protein [Candidatus Adiutrix sp.]